MLSIVLLGSCNKYSEKVAGTYIGQISVNDSIISSNADIIISEISDKRISVSSDFFTSYVIDIEKRRYFSSVTYYHESDLEMIEFGETATGLFLTCFHYDSLNNKYFFHGESN
jgi:hypothetical protein